MSSHNTSYLKKKEKRNDIATFLEMALICAVVKLVMTSIMRGYNEDVGCFTGWSEALRTDGLFSFYRGDMFADYPPGYVFVMWAVANIRHLLFPDMSYFGDSAVLMLKLVPIVFDFLTGILIYKLARKRFDNVNSTFLFAIYVLSPGVVVDSSMWCQVDSVYSFFVFLMCFLCLDKKRIPAYFCLAVALLMKPQALMFGPFIVYIIIQQVFLEDFSWKKFARDLIGGLAAIGSMVIASLPFGFDKVIKQYSETLGSYEYASLNAYNFWALIGKNAVPQDETFIFTSCKNWGTFFIIVSLIFCSVLFFAMKERKDRYFLPLGLINLMVFWGSVRMHERYMFPSLAFILLAYVVSKKRYMLVSYLSLSLVFVMNEGYELYNRVYNDNPYPSGKMVKFTAFLLLVTLVYTLAMTIADVFFKRVPDVCDSNMDNSSDKNNKKAGVSGGSKTKAASGSVKARTKADKAKYAVILDVDGTLWNTTEVVASAWNRAVKESKISALKNKVIDAEILKKEFGKPMDVIADDLFGTINANVKKKLLARCCEYEHNAIRVWEGDMAYPNMRNAIEKVAADNTVFIVSNCQKGYIELVIAKNRLSEFIADYECFGNTGLNKAENIKLIMEKNNIKKACYVGDTYDDYLAAESAGIDFIWASYGFGNVDEAKYKIDSIEELPDVIGTMK